MAVLRPREKWRGAKEGHAEELMDKWFGVGSQWVLWGFEAVLLMLNCRPFVRLKAVKCVHAEL